MQCIAWKAHDMQSLPENTLVLASASPRRAELLRRLGLEVVVKPAYLQEGIPPGLGGSRGAAHLARAKAEAIAADVREGWVLGADTVVWHAGHEVPKPASAKEALDALRALQGVTHEVFTGLCVVRMPGGKASQRVERSEVRFARLDDATLEAYVATGEPLGKAGGYAVQGIAAAYIEDVRGSVDNVIGLPLRATVQLLAEAGYPLPPHLWLPR